MRIVHLNCLKCASQKNSEGWKILEVTRKNKWIFQVPQGTRFPNGMKEAMNTLTGVV